MPFLARHAGLGWARGHVVKHSVVAALLPTAYRLCFDELKPSFRPRRLRRPIAPHPEDAGPAEGGIRSLEAPGCSPLSRDAYAGCGTMQMPESLRPRHRLDPLGSSKPSGPSGKDFSLKVPGRHCRPVAADWALALLRGAHRVGRLKVPQALNRDDDALAGCRLDRHPWCRAVGYCSPWWAAIRAPAKTTRCALNCVATTLRSSCGAGPVSGASAIIQLVFAAAPAIGAVVRMKRCSGILMA